MERGHEIKVLDHGYIRLIDWMGSDESIIEAARMSTGRGFVSWDPYKRCRRCDAVFHPSDGFWIDYHPVNGSFVYCGAPGSGVASCDMQDFPRGDLGLLDTMYKNKHSTPFEFGQLHIEVQAPLMVFREWHRHRTQSYSEFSARYSQMPDLHYLPAQERWQEQSRTNKQGSGKALHESVADQLRYEFGQEQRDVYESYQQALNCGLAKEVARLNTPVSRYSKMRATSNLRNWLGFLLLRKSPAAQWEIRQYADAVSEVVKAIWPLTYALFEEYDLHGVHLSRTETAQLIEWIKTHPMHDNTHTAALFKKLGVK